MSDQSTLTVAALVLRQMAATPNTLAVTDARHAWTYAQLRDRALNVVGALRNAGVRPGDRIGISTTRDAPALAAIVGAVLAGAVYVPLDPAYPADRRLSMAALAGIRLLLGNGPIGTVEQLAIDRAIAYDRPGVAWTVRPADLMYILFTSGSTGTPKGVQITHGNFMPVVRWMQETIGAEAFRRTCTTASLNFDPSLIEIFGPLITGGTVHATDGVFAMIEENAQPTLVDMTPSVALEVSRSGLMPSSVRCLVVGGDILLPKVAELLLHTANVERLISAYGPTETTINVTHLAVTRERIDDVTIGFPLVPGTVRILDEQGRELGVGQTGEIVVFGAQVGAGYVGGASGGYVRIGDRPAYRTGDLGRTRANGEIEFLGRADRQIKLRGMRIEQSDIENNLVAVPGVDEAVVKVSGSGPDAFLVAYVVGRTRDADDIRSELATRVPDYMVPKVVVFLADMPRTDSNKVDLKALPDVSPSTGDGAVPPASNTPADGPVPGIVAQSLELGFVPAADADLVVDLHATSLSLIRVVAAIHSDLGVRIPISSVLGRTTVADLERFVSGSEPDGTVTVNRSGTGTRLVLIAAYIGDVLRYRRLAEHLSDHPVTILLGREPDSPGPASIRDMAEQAIAKMDLVRDTEYQLCGHSAGGLVAYEAARILIGTGHRVRSVTLIDTSRIDSAFNYRWGDIVMNVPELLALPLRQKVARIRQILRRHLPAAPPAGGGDLRELVDRGDVANNAAVARYRAQPNPGLPRMTVLVTRQGMIMAAARNLRWQSTYARSVEFIRIPGAHTTMFEDGTIAAMASAIRSAIER